MDCFSEDRTSSAPALRSRFRGLSFDKKYNGWRVRLYFNKKQRHVGRYADEVTAAKAYDKAAVYLYGADAITNFGLEACLADTNEVSPFIIAAKAQAEQEALQQQQQQQQALGCGIAPVPRPAALCSSPCSPVQQPVQHVVSSTTDNMLLHTNSLPAAVMHQLLLNQAPLATDPYRSSSSSSSLSTLTSTNSFGSSCGGSSYCSAHAPAGLPPLHTYAQGSHAISSSACIASPVGSSTPHCTYSTQQRLVATPPGLVQQQQQQQQPVLLLHQACSQPQSLVTTGMQQQQQMTQQQLVVPLLLQMHNQPVQLSVEPQVVSIADYLAAAAAAVQDPTQGGLLQLLLAKQLRAQAMLPQMVVRAVPALSSGAVTPTTAMLLPLGLAHCSAVQYTTDHHL